MDIEMIDITIHIAEELSEPQRRELEEAVHRLEGVLSTHIPEHSRHLLLVELNPRLTDDKAVIAAVRQRGLHAELLVPERL